MKEFKIGEKVITAFGLIAEVVGVTKTGKGELIAVRMVHKLLPPGEVIEYKREAIRLLARAG